MSGRQPFAPGVGPTLLTLMALPILLWLGTWQVYRLDWKTELLETIAQRMDQAPVALPARIEDPADWRYRPVRLEGRFDHSEEVYLFTSLEGGGWLVYTPLIRQNAPPILINRGWVPDDRRNPATRRDGLIEGKITLIGLARQSRTGGGFVPDNKPDERTFFKADLNAMAAAMGLDSWAPLMVDQQAENTQYNYPKPGQTQLEIPNNHLSYAITWYAMALILLIVYTLYGRQRGKKRDG